MFTVSTTEKGLGDNDGHIATVTMDINTGCWGLIEQKKTTDIAILHFTLFRQG